MRNTTASSWLPLRWAFLIGPVRCQFLYHGGSWFAGYQGTCAQNYTTFLTPSVLLSLFPLWCDTSMPKGFCFLSCPHPCTNKVTATINSKHLLITYPLFLLSILYFLVDPNKHRVYAPLGLIYLLCCFPNNWKIFIVY